MADFFASPDGGFINYDGALVATLPLPDAVARLRPGDTLRLTPGTYRKPAVLTTTGMPYAPIRIIGPGNGRAVLDGGQVAESARHKGEYPTAKDFAFLKILRAHHVEIAGLSFDNCWPASIYIGGAQHVLVRSCQIRRGRFGVYAANAPLFQRSRHIELRDVHWVQDVEQSMWRGDITWEDVKLTKGKYKVDASYFNGALFGSYDLMGPVTMRDCTVEHAFNGFIMRAPKGTMANRNMDIRVLGCHFSYLRDNAIEPERYAERLWVVGNTFLNVHASYSLDGVAGRDWYYFGNTHLKLSTPPTAPGKERRDGKIFKFYNEGPFPFRNFYAAYNSVQTFSDYVGEGQTRAFTHANNAIGQCDVKTGCPADAAFFRDNSPAERFVWDRTLAFGPDLSDHPDFPHALSAMGYPVTGTNAGAATFEPPMLDLGKEGTGQYWDRNLVLREGIPRNLPAAEMVVRLPDGRSEVLPERIGMGAPAPERILELAYDQ